MKLRKVFLFILVLMLSGYLNVNAMREYTPDEINNNTYIIGHYLYNRESSYDSNNNIIYGGALTTEHVMLASKSINSDSLSNMIIYYKSISGVWKNAINNNVIELDKLPEKFEITHINAIEIPDQLSLGNLNIEKNLNVVTMKVENSNANSYIFSLYDNNNLVDTIDTANNEIKLNNLLINHKYSLKYKVINQLEELESELIEFTTQDIFNELIQSNNIVIPKRNLGETDDSPAIKRALATLNNLGGGTLYFENNEYLISTPIIIYKNINYIGSLKNNTIIKLKEGSNCDMMISYRFDDYKYTTDKTSFYNKYKNYLNNNLTETEKKDFEKLLEDLPQNYTISNLILDGNTKFNGKKLGTNAINNNEVLEYNLSGNIQGSGIKQYGKRFIIHNVIVKNVAEIGVYCEYKETDVLDFVTSYNRFTGSDLDFKVYNSGKEGFIYRGPQDQMASDIELYNTMLSNNSNITYHSNSLNIKSAMVLETYSVGYGANLEIGKLKISGSNGNALSVYGSVRLKANKIDIEYTNGGIYLDNKSFSQISNINIENMLKSNNNTTYDYPYLSINSKRNTQITNLKINDNNSGKKINFDTENMQINKFVIENNKNDIIDFNSSRKNNINNFSSLNNYDYTKYSSNYNYIVRNNEQINNDYIKIDNVYKDSINYLLSIKTQGIVIPKRNLGETNDSPAIKRALDILNNLGGGIIYFSNKEYIINEPIKIYSNIKYIGNGLNNTRIVLENNSNTNLMETEKYDEKNLQTNFEIRNLTLDGNANFENANNINSGGNITYKPTNNLNTNGIKQFANNFTISNIKIQNIANISLLTDDLDNLGNNNISFISYLSGYEGLIIKGKSVYNIEKLWLGKNNIIKNNAFDKSSFTIDGNNATLNINIIHIFGHINSLGMNVSNSAINANNIIIEGGAGGINLNNNSTGNIYKYDGHNLSLGTRKHSYVDINTSNINMYNVQLIRTNDRTYKDYVKLNGNNNSILNITILGNSKYIENEYITTYENGGHGNGLYISGSNNIIDFVNIIGITGFGSNYDKNLNNYALSINDVGSNNVVKYAIIDYSRKNSINSNNSIKNIDTINNIEFN